RELRKSLERARHVAQRGRNRDEKARIFLHPVDVLEAGCVLELSLNGEQVEEAFERRRRDRLSALPFERGEVPLNHALNESPIELDVAIAEQRPQIVLARAQKRVLKVNHHHLTALEHQIAALVIPKRKPARLGGKPG